MVSSLDARHVNHPHRVTAFPKPVELCLAARCGLDVPRTAISNSSGAIKAFMNGSHGPVRKLFSCHVLDDTGHSTVGHTRLITDDDLNDLDRVALTAHQVQSYVDKLMDVRVVVVGDRIFPVAIYPQSEAARVDFRADYRALRHELIELPVGVTQGIRRFMAESGLLMASMDFSVDRDGRYYFLESNPAGGQYGWLEARTGAQIHRGGSRSARPRHDHNACRTSRRRAVPQIGYINHPTTAWIRFRRANWTTHRGPTGLRRRVLLRSRTHPGQQGNPRCARGRAHPAMGGDRTRLQTLARLGQTGLGQISVSQ